MTPSIFDDADALVAAVRDDMHLAERVAVICAARFSKRPEDFERLIWYLLCDAACFGAKRAIGELAK